MSEIYEIPLGYSCDSSIESGGLVSVVENINFSRRYGFNKSDPYGDSGILMTSKIILPDGYLGRGNYEGKMLEVDFVPCSPPEICKVEGRENTGVGRVDAWLLSGEIDFLHMYLFISEDEFLSLEDYLFKLSAIDKYEIRFSSNVLGFGLDCKWNAKNDSKLADLLVESFSFNTVKIDLKS